MCKKVVSVLLLFLSLSAINSCSSTSRVKTEPDVVFVTTPHKVVREMLKLADLKKDDVLYDLGSGDGRIVITAASDFGAKAVGIEIDEKLVSESVENARKANVTERASFKMEDIFKADIHKATVITLFLLPGVNQMLIPKLFEELEPGTRVVSHRFDMDDWKPDMTLRAYDSTVYFWFIPASVDGDWSITVFHEKEPWQYTFRFYQSYQEVRGKNIEKKIVFRDIKLFGKEINMLLENDSIGFGSVMELEGQVKGDTMEGTARVKGGISAGAYTWKGVRIKRK